MQAGRARAVAVTSAARAVRLPEVPPIADALPGYAAIGWAGLCAPAATPRPVVDRINADVTALLRTPAVAARMVELGGTPAPQSPDECARFVRAEIAKWREVARAANVRL